LLRPNDAKILVNFIEASKKIEKYELLEAFLKKMIELNPDIPEFPYLMAECLCWQGRFSEAIELLETNIKTFPNHEESNILKNSLLEYVKNNKQKACSK